MAIESVGTAVDQFRAEYPNMSALALLATGAVFAWGVSWFLFKNQLATYKAKLEHLQEVLDGKLPASTYKPLRFRKERPVIAGIVCAWIGIVFVAVGLFLVIANFRTAAPTQTASNVQKIPEVATNNSSGPLIWAANLTMEGGPLSGSNVFTLQFRGVNRSKKEVQLKAAKLISAIDGTEINLEIVADNNEIVPLGDIGLIPPNAPITLVAKFGPPNPNAPGKILGIQAKEFLEKWQRFSVNIEDDVTTYRLAYDELAMAPFFPNMVGPRVSKKSGSAK